MEPFILVSSNIYDGRGGAPIDGFAAVENGRIIKVGDRRGLAAFAAGRRWRTLELCVRSVTPCWCDCTVFFEGYAAQNAGSELSGCRSLEECVDKMLSERRYSKLFYANNAPACALAARTAELDAAFGDTPAVLIARSRYACSMNSAAKREFGFDEKSCYSEAYHKLLAALCDSDDDFERLYCGFARYLYSNGVTAARDIAYDLTNRPARIAALKRKTSLPLKLAVVSQPNAEEPDYAALRALREKYCESDLRFSGLKMMVDDMAVFRAEDSFARPKDESSYELIARRAAEADAAGLRVSLHADGDRAAAWCVETLGALPNATRLRHSIISASLIRERELYKMRERGIVLEIYPTILGAAHEDITPQPFKHSAFIREYLSDEERERYLNYREIFNSGVSVCCGSDLPYMPYGAENTVRCAVKRLEPDGSPFMPRNAAEISQIVSAWTDGGYKAHGFEGGELCEGMPADIAVFDRPLGEDGVSVSETYIGGELVFSNERAPTE